MKFSIPLLFGIVLFLAFGPSGLAAAGDSIRVLIVDGRNSHDWRITTDALRATLNATGRFEVSVSTAPGQKLPGALRRPDSSDAGVQSAYKKALEDHAVAARMLKPAADKAWQGWRPDFDSHDVVILNYTGRDWPANVRTAFVNYVRSGGGVFLVHGATNAFRNWEEYNEIIGLGWRPATHGKAIKVDPEKGEEFQDEIAGSSAHGSKHSFQVTVRQPDHPVMQGLPGRWMHAKDELCHDMRGPARNLRILSSAWSDPGQRGTGQHEPITWEVTCGRGRAIVTSMGHCYHDEKFWESLHCVGFQTILARSCEYLATGKVTLPVPLVFPGINRSSVLTPSAVSWREGRQGGGHSETETRASQKKKENPYVLLSPEEEATTFEVQPGYLVEVVAAEPEVEEPVLTVFDGNGAMYVAEMRSYMQDVEGTGTKTLRNGRIKRMEDTNGDGRMDKVTIFVDNLNLPRMILPLDDRIAVRETDTMDIVAWRDTDGDGVADESTTLYKRGAYSRNGPKTSVEHQDSGLVWNLDNHIYLSYNMERYRFTDGEWKAERQRGHWTQWGLTHGDMGDLYWVHNSDPVASPYLHPKYWSNVGRLAGREIFGTPVEMAPPYEPGFRMVKSLCLLNDRGGRAAEDRGFTSACGQSIFRGHALPWENQGNHFVCDPTIHVVRRSTVTRKDGLEFFEKAETGDGEFLRSSDINCRFVNTATGPDGCLYVTDMYRGIIQDAPWLSPGPRKAIVEAGLDRNIRHGRIWRIRHVDHTPGPRPRMLEETTVELVRHLSHDNGWWRDTAQKLIILREDREGVVSLLKGAARFAKNPLYRLHALWTLEGIGDLDRGFVEALYHDRDPRVRRAAIQVSERWIAEPAAVAGLRCLAGERDGEVAQQLVLTLGMSGGESRVAAEELIQEVAQHHLRSRGMMLAVGVALWGSDDLPLIRKLQNGEHPNGGSGAQWKAVLTNWKRGIDYPKAMSPDHRRLVRDGEVHYFQSCVSCHGPDGNGVMIPGADVRLAPALTDSPRLDGAPAPLVFILLHGLSGPLDGKTYQGGFMAPAAALGLRKDRDVAAVLSYLRFRWGPGDPVSEKQVAETRAADKERDRPWTQAELETLRGR